MPKQKHQNTIMVYEYIIDGLTVRTGDILCTTDGGGELLVGEFWRLVGKMIPGDIDHIVIYIGPGGRCVESGATGRVIEFEIPSNHWDADAMYDQRKLIDTFYGIAYPLADKGFSEDRENQIRKKVRDYCVAKAGKPYNLNFLDSGNEDAFYCSQIAYKAYLTCGINLNTDRSVVNIPGTSDIVFPQEIWNICVNKKV